MAKLVITSYIDIGSGGFHNASSWQVALDPEFTQIIDQSLGDDINVSEWHTMLPKIDGSGYYADLDNLYARVKVHIDEHVSEWFTLESKSQNTQNVIITELNKPDILTNSAEIGMM